MPTRREFLGWATAVAFGHSLPPYRAEPTIDPDDLKFLQELAMATIQSATKPSPSFPFVTPGGDYPALWVRDFSMAVGCGLIPSSTILTHLRLIAKTQNGASERKLASGAILPPFAIPDHINFDGKPVFYPGTYSSGDDQGGEPWGVLPPVDDHYEFIHIAHTLWKQSRHTGFLSEEADGLSLFDRLKRALECPRCDPETGLVVTEAGQRAVGFGFCDGVYLTGSLLFASLLRFRALGEMIELARAAKQPNLASPWKREQARIRTHLFKTFHQDGWLRAATGVGRQADVWGTAFATQVGAVSRQDANLLSRTLAKACREGTISYKGAIRHVPTDGDFSETTAWETTANIPHNRYQNGAYWHVPTGWVAAAIANLDRKSARRLVAEMVAHFREEDHRIGPGKGAPWECLHPEGNYRQNPVYTASITLPLEVLSRLGD